jgi:hypothetical protein
MKAADRVFRRNIAAVRRGLKFGSRGADEREAQARLIAAALLEFDHDWIAPMIVPSRMTGRPPSSGVMSLTASRRSPAPPAAMTSSSALLGRLNRSAVLALPSETPIDYAGATRRRGIRCTREARTSKAAIRWKKQSDGPQRQK